MSDSVEIIGIDHGFRNMKTAHCIFQDRISRLPDAPDDLEGVLEYQGRCYTIFGEELSSAAVRKKTENESFYLLTLAALAKELQFRRINRCIIRIAAGLPQKWHMGQKKEFKSYLWREKELSFRYEGQTFHVMIENVSVYTQGYAALFTSGRLQEHLMDYCVVADIGGETIDIIPIENGKVRQAECKIDTHATIWLMNSIQERIETEFYETVPARMILNCMNKNREYEGKGKYEKLILAELRRYADFVFTRLKEFRINLEATPIVWAGGGAALIQKFGHFDESFPFEFITDLCANAKGYEIIEKIRTGRI